MLLAYLAMKNEAKMSFLNPLKKATLGLSIYLRDFDGSLKPFLDLLLSCIRGQSSIKGQHSIKQRSIGGRQISAFSTPSEPL